MLFRSVCSVDFLSFDVKRTESVHIIDHLVAYLHTFSCLLKSILVSVNLRQYSAILQLEFPNNKYLPHPVGNALFFEIEEAQRKLLKCMLYTLGAFLQHLHLLVAQRHIVEHDEQMVHISATSCEIYSVHDSIGLLQEIQSLFKLFFLDKTIGAFIQLSENYWDLILADSQFFVIMLIEQFVFNVADCILLAVCLVH